MKKLFVTFMTLLSITAIGLLSACGSDTPEGEEDTDKISVTYTFVIGEETVAFTAKQEENSVLSYSCNLVEYEDVWYSDAECKQLVTTVTGEDMTVYTAAEDIFVRVIFQSELGNSNGEFALRKGATAPAAGNKVGYDFTGWSYGGNLYAAGETIPLDDVTGSLVTVQATFTIQSYSVTYKSEGQADEVRTQEYGSAVAGAPTRKGYDFAGWFDQEDKEVTTIESAITLTAKWNIKKYTVSVNGEEDVYDWGTQIPLNEISREGYDYLGWQKSVGGGAPVDISGSSYLVGNDDDYEALSVVLTPRYKGQPRTVTIVGGKSNSATVTVGDNLYESLQAYEPNNFSGWFYDGEYTDVLQKDDTMPVNPITVYATTGRTYTVTFVNGADERQEAYGFNTGFKSEDDAEKEGHTFIGWYDAEEDGEQVTGVWAEDITVYAYFTVNTYVVSFDPDIGEGFIDDIVVEYGTEIALPDSTGMKKSTADFLYWEDEAGTQYNPGDWYLVLNHVTFRAVWDVTLVSITLNDWDGYTIWTGRVEAGLPFDAAHDALQLWYGINEFNGFTYEGKLGVGSYTLNDGDVITDAVLEIVATAVYVNRYTDQVLQFPRVSNLVFALRDDAGHTNEYLISAKEGTLSTDPNKAKLNNTFKGAALSKSLHLPSTYQGKLVTGISAAEAHYYGAFSIAFPSSLTGKTYDPTPYTVSESVYIPSCYSFIGAWSFAAQKFKTLYIGQNSAITKLVANSSITGGGGGGVNGGIERIYGFPDNITRIEEYGFTGTSKPNDPNAFIVYDDEGNRITELPSSITYLGSYALSGVDIFRKVDLSNVTYIGAYLFDGKVNLEELIIGNKITTIPNYAFRACTSLRAVHIPAQVTSIGANAFMIYQGYEGSLSSLTFAQDSKLKTIGDRAFFRCPIESLILPEGLETIGDAAFAANTNYEGSTMTGTTYYPDMLPLHFLQLPNSLRSIGSYAFASTSIPEIKWGSGLQIIGEYAFYDTPNLKYLTIPDSVTEIKEGAFKKRYSFEYTEGDYFTLTISGNVEIIGKYAFQNFKNIRHLAFAANSALKQIETYAFANCLDLTGELILPSGLEYMGGYVFVHTGTGIVATSRNPGSAQFTKIFIPASVTKIDYGGFMYMESLKEVEFEDNQEEGASLSLSGNVFAYCNGLTSISFPCHLTEMRGANTSDTNPETGEPYYSGSMAYCKNLTTVIFRGRAGGGDSELHIWSCVFEGCEKVTEVYIGRDTEIVVENTIGSVVAEVNGTGASMLLRHAKNFNKLWVISSMWSTYRKATNRWCSAAGGLGKVLVWDI